MCNDGIFAIYDHGVIAALIKHTDVDAEHICKISGTVECAFIRADNHHMILIDDEIRHVVEQGTHELIRRGKVIEAAQRGCVLYSGVVRIEGDKVGNAHFSELCQCIGTVQRFTATSFVLTAFIQEGHNDIDSLCLTFYGGNHSF